MYSVISISFIVLNLHFLP